VDVLTDVLAATTDGSHILGASVPAGGGDITLADIDLTIPSLNCLPPDFKPAANAIVYPSGATIAPLMLTTVVSTPPEIPADAAAVNQIVPSPASSLAFITYTPPATGAASGVSLPYYVPGTDGHAGTVGSVPLGGSSASAITAPIAGAFSPDDTYFFVSTAGDNMIHYITVSNVLSNPAKADSQQISPNLTACTPGADLDCVLTPTDVPASNIVPATAIAVKPRATT
jgi:hypothetical protein